MPAGPTRSDDARPSRLRRVCVFCGSSPGRDPADLFAFFDRTVADGFLRVSNREQLYCAPTVPELLDLLEAHEPRVEPKWIDP